MYRLCHITTVPQSLYYFLVGQCSYSQSRGFMVFAISSPGPLLEEFSEREAVQVYPCSMPRAISPLKDLLSVLRLRRLLIDLKLQIVHSHTPKGGLLGMVAAFLARVPVRIYHIHGSPYVTATGWRRTLLKCTEKVSCILATRILVVSHSVLEEFVKDGLCPPHKAKVLLKGSINGVDAEGRFNPELYDKGAIRKELNLPHGALVIGFIGRLVCDKGIRELVAAWEVLKREFPTLYLVIVGSFEERDALPMTIRSTIMSDERILFLGELKDPIKIYAAMDVFVLPTYREGLPLVPLEAQAMKIPVVATRVMGCVDAIEDGTTGTLVSAGSVEELSAAIASYLKDPKLRLTHGCNGRKKMLRDFSPASMWAAAYQEYLSLLHEKGLTDL